VHRAGGAVRRVITYVTPEEHVNLSSWSAGRSTRWASILTDVGLHISMDRISSWIVYHFHDTSMLAPMRRVGSVRDNEYLRPDAGIWRPFYSCCVMAHPRFMEDTRYRSVSLLHSLTTSKLGHSLPPRGTC